MDVSRWCVLWVACIDTVTDSETGFVFDGVKIKSFNDAIRRALTLYPDRSRWLEMQNGRNGAGFFLA